MTNPLVDPLVGRTVAHYEILARLGGGGMGVVYKARDTRLGRTLALKFLPQQWSHDEGAKQRFVREAQAASATDHPNICTIHDIETADDGQLFIVMAYYEGQTLKQRLDQGPLPIDEALDIATQLADGLAKAHAQGVVHRDIKPGNLILTEDGIRIVDFGLATFADALQLTVVGSTLGTAAYMSPEQVRGEDVDARTDVWAVGVVLYQMLAGHVPFRGAYAEAIAYAIRNDAPSSLRGERPEIPEEVEQLVFRALHKEAAVRFASGRELARALRQVRGQTLPVDMRTEAVIAPSPAAQRAPGRRRSSRRLLFAAAAVALLAGVPGAWWWLGPVERTPIVVVPVANQTGFSDMEPYRRALTQTMIEDLTDSPNILPLSWANELQTLRRFVTKGTDISSREVIDAFSGTGGARILIVPTLLYENNQWRVRVQVRDGVSAIDTAEYTSEPFASALNKDTAYKLIATAVDLVERHFKASGPKGWFARREPAMRLATLDAAKAFEEGLSWYEEQEYAAAHQSFVEAAKLDPVSPLAQAWRSRAATYLRNDAEAELAGNEAVKLLPEDAPRVHRLFVEAVAAEARRDATTAATRYRDLVRAFPDDVRWAMELALFGGRGAETKDGWSGAVTLYHAALKLDASAIRPHLELCRLYNRLQEAPHAKREGQEALDAYQRVGWRGGEALARFCLVDVLRVGRQEERMLAEKHARLALQTLEDLRFTYNVPWALHYLALASGEQGHLSAAVSQWERALDAALAAGNAPLEPVILSNLGVAHDRLGNGARAAEYQSRSALLYERLGDQRRAARQQLNAAALRITYGERADEAVREVENALTVVRRLGDADFEVTCLETIAMRYRHVGRHAEAEQELSRALNLAKERGLEQKIAAVNLEMARLHFDRSDYSAAKGILEGAVATGVGRSKTRALILLGRVYTRLGDFASAAATLGEASTNLEEGDMGLLPGLNEALGTLAYEAERFKDARTYYQRAALLGTDTFLDQAAVEARAYLGFLEASQGRTEQGLTLLQGSLAQARRMGRVALEMRCLIFLARVHLRQQRPDEALLALRGPRSDAGIGPELRASLYYWMSRALMGGVEAAGYETKARTLLNDVRLPESNRRSFSMRAEIRMIGG